MAAKPDMKTGSDGQISEWIVFGDLHDVTDNIRKIPDLKEADGIIISGDLTQLGGIQAAEKVLAAVIEPGMRILAQTGNMDKPEIDEWLTGKGINIHDRVVELTPEVAVFGIGGSTPTPFNTPTEYPESAYAKWLEECWESASKYPVRILVSHNPPKDTRCDRISSGAHVGSEAVRKFIEKHQPDLCVCGHIHESVGTDQIGKTRIINPGMLSEGGYARIILGPAGVDAELCDIDKPKGNG